MTYGCPEPTEGLKGGIQDFYGPRPMRHGRALPAQIIQNSF
jgi:hypothetical protein